MEIEGAPEANDAAPATAAAPNSERILGEKVTIGNDALYGCDIAVRDEIFKTVKANLRADALDQRFVSTVKLSGLAATKIMMHAKKGVDEGVAANGFPLEVMGLLFGYPTDDGKTVVVTDAFEVPAAGGAHAVEMDPATSVYMAELMESLSVTRPEGKICGWFHSHPFDLNALDDTLGKSDHCWFSQIDVQNQLQWQQAFEQMDGIPFIGIVVDPKTSIRRRRLVMRAFRNYSKMANYDPGRIMPDGKPEPSEHFAFERWGAGWKNYYEIRIDYFNSVMGDLIMDSLGGSLWVDELASSPTGQRQFTLSEPGRINDVAQAIGKAAPRIAGGGGGGGGRSMAAMMGNPTAMMMIGGGDGGGGGGGGGGRREREGGGGEGGGGDGDQSAGGLMAKSHKSAAALATEVATGAARTICKMSIFSAAAQEQQPSTRSGGGGGGESAAAGGAAAGGVGGAAVAAATARAARAEALSAVPGGVGGGGGQDGAVSMEGREDDQPLAAPAADVVPMAI